MGANIAIAATKFVVAGITGSSAMVSEGIHSAVDTGNGALLLIGSRLSEREATVEHPFGHGKELYFWSLIVAVLIFGLGGGLSAYEGFVHILHPEPLKSPFWNYVVLAAAAVFEGTSLFIAVRQFLREKGPRPFWEALHGSKDPTTYTVLAEDSAALIGLAVAAIGVFISDRFGLPEADGAASIVIGLLLALTAILLIREARGLLIGEGLRPDTLVAIRAMVTEHALVRRVGRILSMYIGPDEVLLAFDVQFAPEAPATDVASAIAALESRIRERYPRISRIYIEPRTIEVGAPLKSAASAPKATAAPAKA
jgi:cation diffusion facilitator family transporter